MRFMMIVKPPVGLDAALSSQTFRPNAAEMAAMGRYNDELRRAGILLDLNGLKSTASGAKILFHGADRTVVDGPFSETKEVIGGYWIIQVRSRDEAIEWAKRIPFSTEVHPDQPVEVELRQIQDLDDLPR